MQHGIHFSATFVFDVQGAPARERERYGAITPGFGLPRYGQYPRRHNKSALGAELPPRFRLSRDAESSWTSTDRKARSTPLASIGTYGAAGLPLGEKVFHLRDIETERNRKDYCTWRASLHPTIPVRIEGLPMRLVLHAGGAQISVGSPEEILLSFEPYLLRNRAGTPGSSSDYCNARNDSGHSQSGCRGNLWILPRLLVLFVRQSLQPVS